MFLQKWYCHIWKRKNNSLIWIEIKKKSELFGNKIDFRVMRNNKEKQFGLHIKSKWFWKDLESEFFGIFLKTGANIDLEWLAPRKILNSFATSLRPLAWSMRGVFQGGRTSGCNVRVWGWYGVMSGCQSVSCNWWGVLLFCVIALEWIGPALAGPLHPSHK